MASSRYTFTLDLHSTYSQITLPVTAGDTDRELAISFADGDRPYTFEEGDIASVALKYPETGATAMYEAEISEDKSYCVFELSQKYKNDSGEEEYSSLCPVAGLYDAEVHIFRGGKKIASPYFSLDAVGGLVAGGEIPPADRDELASIYAAEAGRRTAETNRVNAEEARANAETARTEAEETRNELYNEVKTAYESGKLKGEKGDKGDKGGKGDKGDPGEGFKISKTYPSVDVMERGASSDGVPVHGFVIIETGDVEKEDNAKLFIKGEDGKYTYLTDLSGSQGFKGDDGDSIYVMDTVYTEEDDAYNIIKLSDGTELRIKNGRQGSPVAIIGVEESDESGGTNIVRFSNGVELSIKNGKDGVGIADIQKIATNGLVDTYKITLDDGATKYYTVTNGKDGIDGTSVYVASVNSTEAGTTVVFSDETTIDIANGTNGKTAYQYAKEQGFSGTEEAFAIKLAQPIPSKTSDLSNDSGYITSGAINSHNVSDASHNDIRLLIQGLGERLNAIANSTDVDLDDFKEVVAYIKANRGLIDAITTNKINYTDIINDLVTNVTNKPLSAAQGVAIKGLIDNLANNKLDASALTSAINTALAQAKASGEFKGDDGKTPYIQNGYWYINGASTGVKAQGNDYVLTDADKNEIAGMVSVNSNVPDYIITEVERVANAVQSVRTSKTLVFSAMTDIHVKDGSDVTDHKNSLISAQSAGAGLKELQKRIPLDFCALLGDYSYMSSADYSASQTMKDIMLAKKTLNISNDKEIWCVGNHDWCCGTGVDRMLTEDELYAYVGANSDGTKPYDSIERCYGYLDFDNQKIRVIYLNTNDCKDGIDNGVLTKDVYRYMEFISPTQMRWIADVALDFADKSDAADWGVVILSHQPIDYGYVWYTRLLEMLEAYRDKRSVTLYCADYITVVNDEGITTGHYETFDFTGVETPVDIICNVHGHIHNCGSAMVSSQDDPTKDNYIIPWLWRFCVPNMCYGRYNEKYDTVWGEVDKLGNKVEHKKVMGTAKETSFNIVSIDRKNEKIYAHIFGAGKDREIDYKAPYTPPVALFDVTSRVYTSLSTPQYVAATDTREIDYGKCYAIASDGRRGSYPSGKVVKYEVLSETNGFTYQMNSGSGYGIEFPVNIEGGKTYTLKYNGGGYCKLIKFNPNTTLASITEIQDSTVVGDHTISITPEVGFLYSISFHINLANQDVTINNISLTEA